MTPDVLWRRYAAIWAADETSRSTELEACLHETGSYCDPNGLIEGRSALSAYMGNFQQFAPGAKFHISSVAEHHGRSFSSWTLQATDGSVLQQGRSFASHDEQGRLRHITGFFDSKP